MFKYNYLYVTVYKILHLNTIIVVIPHDTIFSKTTKDDNFHSIIMDKKQKQKPHNKKKKENEILETMYTSCTMCTRDHRTIWIIG